MLSIWQDIYISIISIIFLIIFACLNFPEIDNNCIPRNSEVVWWTKKKKKNRIQLPRENSDPPYTIPRNHTTTVGSATALSASPLDITSTIAILLSILCRFLGIPRCGSGSAIASTSFQGDRNVSVPGKLVWSIY